jgi:hypothetical protein
MYMEPPQECDQATVAFWFFVARTRPLVACCRQLRGWFVKQLFERFGFEDAFFVQDLTDFNQVGRRPHRTPVKLNCLFPINSDDLVPRPPCPRRAEADAAGEKNRE